MNSRFGDVLTALLIIVIIGIVGVIGYFGYDFYVTTSKENNAQQAIEEFDRLVATVEKRENTVTEENVVDENTTVDNTVENVANPLDQFTNTTEQPQQQPQTTTKPKKDKVYMEDYVVLGKLEIPKTKVNYPVLEGVTKRSLEIAVAKIYGPGLNKVGNTVIFGHNYRNGKFFSNNYKLSNGDTIYITDETGTKIAYEIYNMYETTPDDADYMTRDTEGRREISLQTCNDDSSMRLIIWAKEKI